MSESPDTGAIPLWARSTNIREECRMKMLLGILYERDADAGYFITGTGLHLAFDAGVRGASREDMYAIATTHISEELAASEAAEMEVRWTKRRPEEEWPDMVQGSIERFYTDVIDPESRLEVYDRAEFIATEYLTAAHLPTNPSTSVVLPAIQTEVDAIVRLDNGRYGILDWKTGATAKADPQQLWLYNYAIRNTPGSPLEGVAPENIDMWFHHVWHGKIQVVDDYPGDEYMKAWLKQYVRSMRDMSETGFAPARPDWYCNYCLVQSKCPLYGGDLYQIELDAKMAPVELVRPLEG